MNVIVAHKVAEDACRKALSALRTRPEDAELAEAVEGYAKKIREYVVPKDLAKT